jgi:hypothetical protein
MAWNRIQAARLLTDKEMNLFEGSLSDQAPVMSDSELKATIRRVRTQRDKYQDLLRRQRVASRDRSGSKSGSSGVANARTDQKVQVFSEALERLEKQHDKRERASSRTSSRPSGAKEERKPATVRSAVREALKARKADSANDKPQARRSSKAPAQGPKARGTASATHADGQGPATVPHTKRAQAMGQARTLAHVSSRGRRQQAGRDSR